MPDPDDIVYTDDGSVTIVAPIATADTQESEINLR